MLLQLIEEKREVLLCLGKTFGLTAKETVICSQELDQLLNQLNAGLTDSQKK